MHIFKNVAVVLWKTITGEKDTKGQRDDLQEQGRMQHLWAQTRPNRKGVFAKSTLGFNQERGETSKEVHPIVSHSNWMHALFEGGIY